MNSMISQYHYKGTVRQAFAYIRMKSTDHVRYAPKDQNSIPCQDTVMHTSITTLVMRLCGQAITSMPYIQVHIHIYGYACVYRDMPLTERRGALSTESSVNFIHIYVCVCLCVGWRMF